MTDVTQPTAEQLAEIESKVAELNLEEISKKAEQAVKAL